jgi:hypothetical protein
MAYNVPNIASTTKASGSKRGDRKIINIRRNVGHSVSPNIILITYLNNSNIYNFHVKDLKK